MSPREAPVAPPWRAALALARDTVEGLLVELPLAGGRVDAAVVAGALGQALDALDRLDGVVTTEWSHVSELEGAVRALGSAGGELARLAPGRAWLAEAAARLSEARQRLADTRGATVEALAARPPAPYSSPPPAPGPQLVVVSAGVPEPLAWSLPAAAAVAPRGAELDDDGDDEGAEAQGDADADASTAGAAATPPVELDGAGASGAVASVRRLARAAADDLGSLGALRWTRTATLSTGAAERFERRLLADLDALAALGEPFVPAAGAEPVRLDVAAEVVRWASDAFVPDPGRAFARTLLLASTRDDRATRAAVIALRTSSPWTHDLEARALSLASSPAAGAAVARLLDDDDPALVAVALTVLRCRRQASFAPLVPLLTHPEPVVREATATCLATVPERGPARALLARALEGEGDDAVAAVIADALVRLDAPEGLAFARERLVAEAARRGTLVAPVRAALVWLVALAGAASDAPLLVRLADAGPDELSALGWLGSVTVVDRLVATAVGSAGYLAEIAAAAIHRLTGWRPADDEEVSADDDDELGASAGAFVERRRWSGEAWGAFRAHWSSAGPACDPKLRHRFGRPWEPALSLGELVADSTVGAVRERCVLELAVVSGAACDLEPDDWVARLRARASSLHERLGERGARDLHRPGEWLADRLGKRR